MNPGFVLGPISSSRADGESIEMMTGLLNGKAKERGGNIASQSRRRMASCLHAHLKVWRRVVSP